MLRKLSMRALLYPLGKWLDPVATAPGSVPEALVRSGATEQVNGSLRMFAKPASRAA